MKKLLAVALLLVSSTARASYLFRENASNLNSGTVSHDRLPFGTVGDPVQNGIGVISSTQMAPGVIQGGGISVADRGQWKGVVSSINFVMGDYGYVSVVGGTATVYSAGETDVTSGTVARFEFNETTNSFTTRDSVISTRTGILYSLDGTNMVWISTGINGSNAFAIGASTGHIGLGDDSWMSSHQGDFAHGLMSISFWVLPRDLSSDRYYIWKGQDSGGNNYEYQVNYTNSSNKLTASLSSTVGAGISTCNSAAGVLTLNTWSHVAIIWDKTQTSGSKCALYVNGSTAGSSVSDSVGTSIDGNQPLVFGDRESASGTSGYCNCLLDKIKFYNRRLTEEDIGKLKAEKIN